MDIWRMQVSIKKRYTILNRIAEGNFGCVYKALDTETGFYFIQMR